MKDKHRQKGFTLIELIAVLLIISIMTALAGMGIVTAVQGYLFSKDNTIISEKTQLAVTRINRELLECYTCKGTIGNPVIMPISNTLGLRTIQLTGTNIEITDGSGTTDILMDNVNVFTMIYNSDGSINTTIQSSTPGGITVSDFVSTVYPRNTP
jgi:prepilin-type N-terminal cleavage/methylation domain-containing protein